MNKRDTIETWMRRVWYEEDMDAIAQMLRPDAEVRGLIEAPQVGPDEFRNFAEAMLGLLSNMRIDIKNFMENDDWGAGLMQISATCRSSGKPIHFDGQFMVRYDDEGNLAEGYNHVDFISLYQQLGLMPEGTLVQCLSGQKIAAA